MSAAPATTPPTAPAARPAPAVSFARKYDRVSNVGRRSKGIRDRGSAIVAISAAVLAFAIVPGPIGTRALIAASVGVAIALLSNLPRRASAQERARWRAVPDSPHRRDRVACVGKPSALALLARQGSIEDLAFEPAAFHALMGVPLRAREWFVWIVLSLAFSAGLFALFSHMLSMGMGYVAVLVAVSAAAFITAALWPTYFRLVPGRFDVLRYNTLGRNVSEVIKHDLRTSAVLVDLNQCCVFLSRDGIISEIGFGAVRNPHAFAHALLLAAVSSHTPAPLPDDALVG